MLQRLDIDIFDADIDILVHQANCFHTMGSGIARAVRERFPEAYEADCNTTEKGDRAKLGTYSFAKVRNEKERIKYVFNMYGQYKYGREKRHTDYEAFYNGLEAMKNGVANTRLIFGFPYRMGCKLGGGNWTIVETMITEAFRDMTRRAVICRLPGDIL